jgi:uncharacterized protein (TIGR01777 family)
MHVLITGGSGFIGRALCQRLLQVGHTLSVVTRQRERTAALLPGVRVLSDVGEAFDVEAVVNLAGEPLMDRRWTARRKQLIRESRLGTTRRLMTWMATQLIRPRVLVSGSAVGYYGPRDDTPLDESAAAGDDFASQLCRDWETEALEAESLGVRVCRLRTGIVLGPDGGALAKLLPAFRLGLGGPLGSGEQWWSWVHRADLVCLIQWLLENDAAGGAYNGTAPEPLVQGEFARTLGRVLHRPARLPTPAFAMKLMLGERSGLLLTGQRVLPTHATAEGFSFQYPELEGALENLLD